MFKNFKHTRDIKNSVENSKLEDNSTDKSTKINNKQINMSTGSTFNQTINYYNSK